MRKFPIYTSGMRQVPGTEILLSALLLLILATVFAQVVTFEFINFDDPIYVTENDHVRQGLNWETVKWAFTTDLHGHFHPLTWLSHALDVELFGLQPWGHHLVNLILHCINTLLLFWVLVRYTDSVLPAFCAAAIFGVHPLHVESVAWIADRKDLLCGLFWMFSLLFYHRWVTTKRLGAMAPLLLCYGLGVLCKTMMITLPAVLLLLDLWPLKRMRSVSATPFFKTLIGEKIPFLFLAAVFVFLARNAMQGLEIESKTLSPLWQYDFILFYKHYLIKFLLPVDLTVFYPYGETAAVRQLLLGAGLLGTITLAATLWARRKGFLIVGWLWFLVTLLPVAGLIHDGPHRVADRYTYIPLVGLSIAVCWFVYTAVRSRRSIQVAFVLVCAAIIVLSGMSYRQASHWKSSESLFRHAVEVYPENWLARNNLGDALDKAGQGDEAIVQYRLALQSNPQFARAHYNLGNSLASRGKEGPALYHFLRAAELFPRFFEAHNNAGILLVETGQLLKAKEHLARALAIRPESEDARRNLTELVRLIDPLERRIRELKKRLTTAPDPEKVLNELGLLYRRGGDAQRAMEAFQQAIGVSPEFAGAYNNLGILHAERHNYSVAEQQFRKALEIDPSFVGARENLLRIKELRVKN